MTTDLAAALIKDVPRHTIRLYVDDLPCLLEKDVLAALSRALDPALTERALALTKVGYGYDLTDDDKAAITALLAQNAALRAERDDAVIKRAAWELEAKTQKARAEAAEAKVKKLRAERDDALTFLDNAVSKAPEPLKALGKYLAGRLDEDEWPTAEQYLNAAAKARADRAEAAEAKVERLRGALQSMPSVVRHTTVCQGPSWPDDRPGVWIAALTACENAVQEAVDAALTTEERHDG